MAVIARKYNPGFLTDDELVASFCVRTHEFASVVEMLRECTGRSNTHQIVIGPRGSGKTSLLLRVAAEIRRDPELQARFFPIVFAEESYEVATAGEFWLECLAHVAAQAPRKDGEPDLHRTLEDLRTVRDDRALGDRCLGALQDLSDRKGRRLVLLVENLNMMFSDMSDPDAGWRLRKVLQTEPRIILLASATSRFDEIDDPEHALFEQLWILPLRPLDTNECAVLWETVSGRLPPPETIRSLEILTGGSPRLITIVARFGAELSFRKLMASLLDLIDDHTEYFKSHLESLAAQERRVYLALAALWKPATTREIADYARTDTSKCSAQLTRLVERGIVQTAGGSARRKQYYLTERLYNIYYLLRRSRRSDRLVEALIRFMELYYTPSELKDIGTRIIREAATFTAEMQALSQAALARMMELPSLAEHRDELLEILPEGFAEVLDQETARMAETRSAAVVRIPNESGVDRRNEDTDEDSEAAVKQLFSSAVALSGQGRTEEALAVFDEVVQRFGESRSPAILSLVAMSLAGKGTKLGSMNRIEDALAVCEELLQRFGENDTISILEAVAVAYAIKASLLTFVDGPEEAIKVYDEFVVRFRTTKSPFVDHLIAIALTAKGSLLNGMNRPKDALSACDEVISRVGTSDALPQLELVAKALVNKATLLGSMNRPGDALEIVDEVVSRFGESAVPTLLEPVAVALFNKGNALSSLGRVDDAVTTYEEIVHRFGQSDSPIMLEAVAKALNNKGAILGEQDRTKDAMEAFQEVVHRFGDVGLPVVLDQVTVALGNVGAALLRLNRVDDALATYENLVHRFEKSNSSTILEVIARTYVNIGAILGEQERTADAMRVFDEMEQRFEGNEAPAILEQVALASFNKAIALIRLSREEEALRIFGEIADRFETTEYPILQGIAGSALVNKGELELKFGRKETALETSTRALDLPDLDFPEIQVKGYLVRAMAALAGGDPSSCRRDLKSVLEILPEAGSFSRGSLDAMIFFSVALGPERMCELIKASPSLDLLLPLTTALELELGLEPRVAREVMEVAEDVRRDLAKLRQAGTGRSGEETLDGAEAVGAEPKDV